MVHFLILAGGKGTRAISKKYTCPKQYQEINNTSPLKYLLSSLNGISEISSITVVVKIGDVMNFKKISQNIKKLRPHVIGGKDRQQSSIRGLKSIDKEFGKKTNQKVIIHDAARPLVSKKLIKACITGLKTYDAICPVLRIDDTIKKLDKKNQIINEDRDSIISIQTPQGFDLEGIISLHRDCNKIYTDDISLALEAGLNVKFIEGGKENFKITSSGDLDMFSQITYGRKISLVGTGFDIHKFTKGNKIILGGIEFKSKYSLLANSDGDVLLHAITDAIFGAIGEGDLGQHFPANNKIFKNKNSTFFLEKGLSLINKKNACIINLDLNLICDYPKITPLKKSIVKNLSKLMNLDIHRINLKATSTEDEGFINSKNGIAAQAIISIEAPKDER